jgi:hypothetical protein
VRGAGIEPGTAALQSGGTLALSQLSHHIPSQLSHHMNVSSQSRNAAEILRFHAAYIASDHGGNKRGVTTVHIYQMLLLHGGKV